MGNGKIRSIFLILVGLGMLVYACKAIYSISGHDAVLSSIILCATALILIGIFINFVDELEIGSGRIRIKIRKLESVVKESQRDVSEAIPHGTAFNEANEDIGRSIIEEASRSPLAAVVSLSKAIEKSIRKYIAEGATESLDNSLEFSDFMAEIKRRRFFPASLVSSIDIFWDIRNTLMHQPARASQLEREAITAVDIGLNILKVVDSLPREKNKVLHPLLDVYKDVKCELKRQNISAVMLETTSSGGAFTEVRTYPTRQKYKIGQRVSYAWDYTNIIGESWIIEPASKKPMRAWINSAEFIGVPLDEIIK